MWPRVVAALAIQLLSGVDAEHSTKCRDPTPFSEFDQTRAAGMWYQVAGTRPCENCCVTHRLQDIKPGVLNITETVKRTRDTEASSNNIVATQDKVRGVYRLGDDPHPYTVVHVDYDDHAVLYSHHLNKVIVFSRKADAKLATIVLKAGVKRCDMKLYQYTPDVSCK